MAGAGVGAWPVGVYVAAANHKPMSGGIRLDWKLHNEASCHSCIHHNALCSSIAQQSFAPKLICLLNSSVQIA